MVSPECQETLESCYSRNQPLPWGVVWKLEGKALTESQSGSAGLLKDAPAVEAGAANHAVSWEGGKVHACESAPGGCLALSPRDGTW